MDKVPSVPPPNSIVLCSLTGHVAARPPAVFGVLAQKLKPEHGSGVGFAADERSFFVVIQSGRWYRAEYRVIPDDHGSHLEHRIFSVALRPPRFGRKAQSRVVADAPTQFDRLLRQLRLELE